MANRILNSVNNSKIFIHNHSLTMFVNLYESMSNALNSWVFSCIRTPFLSILNTQTLNLDITEYKSISQAAEDSYIRLETRVVSFIKCLYEGESFKSLDSNLINYLSTIITSNAYVPKEFFCLFEYSRITTENNILKNLNKNQMSMILAMLIICKILCKNILIDHMFSQGAVKNTKLKNNYKICATLIYRTTIDYFLGKCHVVRTITNLTTFSDEAIGANTVKVLFKNVDAIGSVDKSYIEACKKYEEKQSTKKNKLEDTKKSTALAKVKEKIPKLLPDNLVDEIEVINLQVYKLKDLNIYYQLAQKNKFDLTSVLVEFIESLLKVLNVKGEEQNL